MAVDKDINVVDEVYPKPLVTLVKEIRKMQQGQTLRITGNDPIFAEYIIAFCREANHEILETKREGKIVSIIIKV